MYRYTTLLGMRLDQYLGQNNIASRREAKRLIINGGVLVNNKVIKEPGYILKPISTVSLVNEKVTQKKTTVLIYKPKGIACSHNTNEGTTLYQKFPQYKGLTYVGRLDKESEGLLLMSNDGLITKAITGEHSTIEKEYVVTVRERVLPTHLERIKKGMKIDGERAQPAQAFRDAQNVLRIILKEGKKHQVRRMANALHLTVTNLKRIRIGDLKIGSMKPGNAKILTEKEVADLKKF